MSTKVNIPARVFTLFVTELAILYACYVAGAYADTDIADPGIFLLYDSGFLRTGIAVACVVTGLFFRDLYSEVRVPSRLGLVQELSLVFGLAFLGQGLLSYVDRDWILPRRMMLAGSLIAFVAVFGWRVLLDGFARGKRAAGRVLFLGMTPTVATLAEYFGGHPEAGLMAVGYLESGATTESGEAGARVARLGTMEDLDGVLDEATPDSIVIGDRDHIQPWWTDEFLALRFGGIRVEEAGTLYERVFARTSVPDVWPQRLIFRPELSGGSSATETALSALAALGLAVITLPVTVTAAVLIKAGSRGPVLVTEPRVGLGEKSFQAYRFRCTDGNGELTGVGRFLRRHGLSWLPELLNVMKGEMAVVGPRPERPVFAEMMGELMPVYRQRHLIRPGVTGWARIHREPGAEQDSLRDLEYDLYYLGHHSLLLDVFILLLSLKTVLGGRG